VMIANSPLKTSIGVLTVKAMISRLKLKMRTSRVILFRFKTG
jgi:hypothetical protein